MKILIINTSDIQGGAARAAYRLHQGLQNIAVESQMLVQKKHSDDLTVIVSKAKSIKLLSFIRPRLDELPVKRYRNKTKTWFSPAWLPFSKTVEMVNDIKPDIVHLHWIAGGMLRIEDLQKIKAPIVWSLHDMWAFTGGCHYDENCGNYLTHCGKCPVLGSSKARDLSYQVFRRKLKTYAKVNNLTIVGLSRWIAESAAESMLLKKNHVVNLPNPIDTNVFKPLDNKIAREMFGMSEGKQTILFGADAATTDPNKGFVELSDALEKLRMKDIELAVFGSRKPEAAPRLKYPVRYLGRLNDDLSLRALYSAADVVVVPSRQENLSNVIMESLACGTPVVAFNVGGNPDMVEHMQNGYLAQPYDSTDLASGIEWVMQHHSPHMLSMNAVKKITDCFEMKKVASQYLSLYKSILN